VISAEAEARIRGLIDQLYAVVHADDAPAPVTAKPAAPAKRTFPDDFFEDYGRLYDFLRGNPMLGPVISKSEFEGCDAIARAFATYGSPVSYCAYGFATAFLETASTMQPIDEYGGDAYFRRMYDIQGARPAKARELGNLSPGDGAKYHGRGLVQLTGKTNYARAMKKLREMGFDVDLVSNPDLAKRPDLAAIIMVVGMTEGWFTGRKLADDLPEAGAASFDQFERSRDIINGRDRQAEIARFAIDFQTGLLRAGYRA
jgi:putative chitinase